MSAVPKVAAYADDLVTASGVRANRHLPEAHRVKIADIAAHLAKLNRFAGATLFPLSLAQHSLVLVQAVPAELARHALLLHAQAAYSGWNEGPCRARPDGRRYINRHSDLSQMIFRQFGLSGTVSKDDVVTLARAENIALATEIRDCCPAGIRSDCLPPPLPVRIKPLSWPRAEEAYRFAFARLFPTEPEARGF